MHDELNLSLNLASSPGSPCLGDVQWGWCLAVGNRSFFPLGITKPLCRTPNLLVMAPAVPCPGQGQQDSLHRVPGRHLLYHHKGDLLLPEVREAAQEHLAEEEGPVSACSTLKLFPSPRLRADLLAPSAEQLGARPGMLLPCPCAHQGPNFFSSYLPLLVFLWPCWVGSLAWPTPLLPAAQGRSRKPCKKQPGRPGFTRICLNPFLGLFWRLERINVA